VRNVVPGFLVVYFADDTFYRYSFPVVMNSSPTAEQDRYWQDLRELGCIVTGSNSVRIHHIIGFGSKWGMTLYDDEKVIARPGEWLVIPVCDSVHTDIHNHQYSFKAERTFFESILTKYLCEFGYPAPVPTPLIEYYKAKLSKNHLPNI